MARIWQDSRDRNTVSASLDRKETEGRPEQDKTGLLDRTTEKGQLRQHSHDRTIGIGSRGSSLKINVPD
jgi:hypothetical protein